MSRQLVQKMWEEHVFDSVLLEEDMSGYHVPFDYITGKATTEARLRDAVAKFERVSLTGVPGSGKTSVARYSLEPAPASIAPIWVPVAYKGEDVTTSPKAFAQYLVGVISAAAAAAQRLSRKDREAILARATSDINLPAVARRNAAGLKLMLWLIEANVARDVTRTIQGGTFPRSEQEMFHLADEVLDAIRAYRLNPVLVIDDTDRFIGRGNPNRVIPAFFGEVLRSVVDELHAGIVVAAHPVYLEREDYRRVSSGLIEKHIKIPEIPNVDGLADILTARVRFANARRTASDAFADGALDELFDVYTRQREKSIRAALAAAHAALARAQEAFAAAISADHVKAGADDALLT
jgi:Cdc6-like AAA superfamily ATPase